jgi:NADH:ubiquinone oxidoreductase subunit 3 (subunit A)
VDILLSPPIAFLIYFPLVALLAWIGKQLAGSHTTSEAKTSIYASGEKASTIASAPGYRPFFIVALFFAILHLGMLVLGVGVYNGPQILYVIGLILALVALILG